jgi:hypothetical protein
MTVHKFLATTILTATIALSSCGGSSTKRAYQQPNFKNGDLVLVRVLSGDFRVAEVCATKAEGISTKDSLTCGRALYGKTADDVAKLGDGQIIVAGCLGAYGASSGGPVDVDTLVPFKDPELKRQSPEFHPQVEANDIVIVGDGSAAESHDCYPSYAGDRGEGMREKEYPAVKVIRVDQENNLIFSFLDKNSEQRWIKGHPANQLDGGTYWTVTWFLISPKLQELLKK